MCFIPSCWLLCCCVTLWLCFFFCKQKTAYEMRISDWSSDVGSSDLKGETVITGQAEVRAPCEKVRRPRLALPDVRVATHDGYRRLIEQTQDGEPIATAVAHPCSAAALAAAVDAAQARLIARPEERRGGQECVRKCSAWRSAAT